MVSARGGRLTLGLLGVVLLAAGAGCATAIDPPRLPSRQQVLQRILPATVQISLEQEGRRFRSGSGVVIASRISDAGTECFVLTSGHTLAGLADPQQIFVLLDRHHGKKTKVRARVLARQDTKDLDLALLQADAPQCVAADLGRAPDLGDTIWVVAFPWGREMTLVGGVVSQINVEPSGEGESGPRLMVDASVSYGASGGGVFDATTGRLVGLVEGYHTARVAFKNDATGRYIDVPVPGETYVAPLADIRRFLIETGHAGLLGEQPAIAAPRR